MNDFQKTPSNAELGILLANRNHGWRGSAYHTATGEPLLAYLVPSTQEHHVGYWFVAVIKVNSVTVDSFSKPASPLGVELILKTLGVDSNVVDWTRCDEYAPSAENPFNNMTEAAQ